MLLVFAGREELIKLTGSGRIDHMAELGVYEGEFAEFCYRELKPKTYTLVDFWDYRQYRFVLEDAPQMQNLRSIYSGYFKNDPVAALEHAYDKVRDRFSGQPAVSILKMDIAEAADRFADRSFDLIYLDGNHTYEYVLRDLYKWFPKLATGGLFVCNDFCESSATSAQNLGVIPAYLTFSKRFETYPIALSAANFSDFYFSNAATSALIEGFMQNILASQRHVVDLPSELIANYRHRVVAIKDRPRPRLVPAFGAARATPIAG
jgi:hypothetical protein